MSAALASRSDLRAFLGALAMPMAAAVLLAFALLLGPRGPLVALMLNVFLLFEVAGFGQALGLTLPAGYFRMRPLERPWVYELLGIRAFKHLMRSRIYQQANPHFRLSGGRSGLAGLKESMDSAEAAHALVFLLVSAVAACALAARWFDAAAWLTLFNVPFNAYPVMLQRYNRLRLEALLQRCRRLATLS